MFEPPGIMLGGRENYRETDSDVINDLGTDRFITKPVNNEDTVEIKIIAINVNLHSYRLYITIHKTKTRRKDATKLGRDSQIPFWGFGSFVICFDQTDGNLVKCF